MKEILKTTDNEVIGIREVGYIRVTFKLDETDRHSGK